MHTDEAAPLFPRSQRSHVRSLRLLLLVCCVSLFADRVASDEGKDSTERALQNRFGASPAPSQHGMQAMLHTHCRCEPTIE